MLEEQILWFVFVPSIVQERKNSFFFVSSIIEVWIYSFFIDRKNSTSFFSFILHVLYLKAFVSLCSCKFFASQENRSSCCYWRDWTTVACAALGPVYTLCQASHELVCTIKSSSLHLLLLDLSTYKYTTETCAALGRVYTLGPEFHLDVLTLQSPLLHLAMFPLQGPSLDLDMFGQQ